MIPGASATDGHGRRWNWRRWKGRPVAEYAAKWHAVQKRLGDRFA
jgi:hypothetical protein